MDQPTLGHKLTGSFLDRRFLNCFLAGILALCLLLLLLFFFQSLIRPEISGPHSQSLTANISGSQLTKKLYVNEWVVQVPPEFSTQVDHIAHRLGFTNIGPVMPGFFIFIKPNHVRRSTRRSVVHDSLLKREKRNRRNTEHNVEKVWKLGVSGKDIVVAIMDDGLEITHPDISENYDPRASYDLNDNDPDPTPRYDVFEDENKHGTRCAGEVAAALNNSVCIVGVAHGSNIGGIRMLDGEVIDAVEAARLQHNRQHVDIYSASWGPEDDGKSLDGPDKMAKIAFKKGVELGRGGKGSIFVWASGNGGRNADNCNCDGYANSLYTLSISSATETGNIPWYSEACSCTLASTYSSGAAQERQIVTTDLYHKCTETHTGTSASAPIVAGMCALALEVNPQLTWRDMQHIVIRSAVPHHLNAPDWQSNKAGRVFSLWFGYGLLDAFKMVKLAKTWRGSGVQKTCKKASTDNVVNIKEHSAVENSIVITPSDCSVDGKTGVVYAEHVQARITIRVTGSRGDLEITLVSPHGTKSTLLSKRVQDLIRAGFSDWPFMSVHFWGETVTGTWKLEIHNNGHSVAVLVKWTLVLHGTSVEVGENEIVNTSPRSEPIDPYCCSFSDFGLCTACLDGRFLFLNKCMEECPQQYGADVDRSGLKTRLKVDVLKSNKVNACARRICKPCSNFCISCLDLINSTNDTMVNCSSDCVEGFVREPSSGHCIRLKVVRSGSGPHHLSNNYNNMWKWHEKVAGSEWRSDKLMLIGLCSFLGLTLLAVLSVIIYRYFARKNRTVASPQTDVQFDSRC